MNKTLVVAIAAVLVGGVAVAAYQTTRGDYAEVIEAKPVTRQVDVFAQVVSATPVTQMVTGTREVCEDRQVEYTSNETRDPNKITGTVAGAVVGGAGFLIALPFTLPTGTAGQTAREWVGAPLEYTFNRPLGDFRHCGAERRPCGAGR